MTVGYRRKASITVRIFIPRAPAISHGSAREAADSAARLWIKQVAQRIAERDSKRHDHVEQARPEDRPAEAQACLSRTSA